MTLAEAIQEGQAALKTLEGLKDAINTTAKSYADKLEASDLTDEDKTAVLTLFIIQMKELTS